MERVAFLIESSGERLRCMLNPDSLRTTRAAGVRARRAGTGLLGGGSRSDDPLLYAGGGQTELTLDLLFDVGVAGSTIATTDIRDLTRPLWTLAETSQAGTYGSAPPIVRFLWGKTWNVPGVVTAVAERLEAFGTDGAPRRSWLRMRLVRVAEEEAQAASAPRLAPAPPAAGPDEEQIVVHQVMGAGPESVGSGERLEDVAFLYYGDPSPWRLIAAHNDIVDAARVPAGTLLTIPPAPGAGGGL